MSSELFFENKKYISAKDASALTGYSKDYIGQLSRQNKIDSRKIGKVWYVSEESLLNYKNLPTESSLDPKKNSPEIPSEIPPVSAEDSAPELPSGNSQTALETKVFSATRDADQDAGKAVSPAPEILPKKQPSKYKQFAHEVLFALDTNLAKKAIPLALGLLLAIGFGVFARDAESFRQDSELGALPAKLSAEVAALPRLAYDAVSSVVDMYAGKAYPAYLSFGDFLIKKTSLLASDPLEFVADSAKGVVAFSRNSFNRTAGVFGEALLSLNDRAFAFISDAVSVKSSDLTAAVAVASQGKLNVVDHSGVVVYETINRWFEQGIYNPIASLFGKREPTIIYVATAPQASSTPAAAKPATVATTVNPTKVVNTTNVIERVVEREVAGDFTKADVETLVAQLDSKIQAELAGLSTGSGGVVNNIYQEIAQSQRIDQLNNTTINNPTVNGGTIANANITGGTIDGATLNNVTLGSLGSTTIPNLAVTNTSTSTFSGGLAVSGGCVSVNGICLGTGGGGAGNPGGSDGEIQFNNGGSFDGGVAFVYASSTGNVGIGTTSPYAKLSVAGTVVADSFNATSTTATSTFANGVNLTGGCFAVNGVCFTGSGSSFSYPFPGGATSTPLSFAYSSTTYASFTTASTTNFTAGFFTLSTTTAGTLKTTSTGLVYIDTSSGTAASSTLLSDTNTFTGRQIFANSSTTLGSFNYASATTANIGTLNLFAGLNGPLQANGGVVSATTSIGVLYGGTGLAAAPAYGQVLVGNSSGGYTLTATSSLGLGASFTTTYPLQLSGNNLSLLFGTTTANNWGAVQTFAYSSTTYASFTAASTTNLSIGGQTFISLLGTGLTNSGGVLTIDTTAQNSAINSYINSSTTIPKTYAPNAFTALNTFSNSSTTLASFSYASATVANIGTLNLSLLSSGALAVNGTGQVYSFSTSTWTFASSTLLGDSNTFSGANKFTGSFSLPSLAQGFAYLGTNGTVNTIASSTVKLSWFTNDAGFTSYAFPFTVNVGYNSTSTAIGFGGGLFSTASSTFSSALRLTSLSQGLTYVGSTGLVSTIATTSAACSGSVSCSGFTIIGSSPVTITGTDSTASTTLFSDTNTFTGRQIFTNSSTTLGSFNYASATTAYIGTLNLGGPLTLSGAAVNSLLSTNASGQIVATSTPTFGSFNATSTNATSTIAGGLAVKGTGFVYDFSSNRVGIGTAAPTQALDITGNINVTGGIFDTGSKVFEYAGSNSTIYAPGGAIIFQPNGNEAARFASTGFLGLGSTTPGYRLSVAGSGYFDGGTVTANTLIATSSIALPNSSQGFAYLGTGGLVQTIASSSVKLSWFNNDAGFLTSLSGAASSTLLSDTNFFSGVNRFAFSSTTYASFTAASTTNLTLGFLNISTSTAGTLKTNASGAVYIDTSSGTAASSTLLADANTFSGVNSFTNALSADVSLSSGNALAVTVGGNPTFAVGKDGRLTYGNAFIVYSTSAAVNFGNNVGSADATTPGYFVINPSSANSGNLFNVQKAGASKFVINTNGNVGIGTTTPFYGLVSASSTAPQLSLSAGTGIAQWAFRNAGGNFYLSTTTIAGTATTSNSALSIDGTTGVVTLAKALPETSGGTNQTSYATGDILYASAPNTLSKLPIGGNGLVLKVVGGLPSWQTDLTSGGGGGATAWSTTTDSLAIYPTDTTDVLLLGTNSTSTTGNIFEVLGNSLFRGNLAVTGSATFAYSSTTYASFATASTTNLNIGLGQGFAYVGSNGSVNSIASSSVNLSWFNNDAGFLTSLSGAASSTLLGDANTFSGANKFTSLLNYGGTAVNSLLSTDASGNIRATSTPTFGSFNATSTNATSTVAGGFAFGSNSVIQQNSGNLGIGITNPSQALQVNGNAIVGQSITGGFYTPAPLALVNSAAGTLKTQLNLVNTGGGGGAGSAIDFYTYTTAGNGLPESRIGSTDDGNYSASLDFYTKDPGNTGNNSLVNRLHIATGGNIGVGSTSPGYNLSVVGSGYFDGGAVTAKSFVATSSIALPNSSQGFAYLGTGGLIQTIASSTVKLSWFTNDAGFTSYAFPFTVNTGYNSTSTVLGLNGFFSTASSTISGAFSLPAISSGALAVNGSGLVYSFSTSTWTFASSTLLADTNFWSGVNRFALSSTTYGSFTTASTTNLNIGGSSFVSLLGTGLTNSGGALAIDTTAQNNAINSYINASTTIPKTYTSNTFTALNTFSNSSTSLASFSYASSTAANIGTLNLGLSTGGLAVNGAGQVYSFSTSTWTFASSTLLSDANTFSGADRFTGSFSLPSLAQGFAYLGTNGLVQSVSTSTIANYILPFTSYGAATSTVLGLNGFFSTASSTISGAFRLPALSNGGLAVFNGLVSSGATTTAGTGLTYSANAFNVNATQNITNLSNLSSNGVVYTAGSNGTLNTTSTSTLAVGSSLTVSSGALGYQLGGSNATIALNLANPNTWTALQTFTNSSTTLGSFAYASATAAYIGTLNLGSLSQGYSYVGSNGALNTVSTSTLAGQVFPFTSSTGYNSTSTAIGFGGGLFSTASSTFSSALRLSSLSQGFAYLGSSGTVNSIASSSINLSWFTNDAGFLTNYDAFTHPGAGYSATTSSFAVGTSTSFIASLTIASSTANQLSLSAGTGLAQFTFRNAGGNLYLSTTTVAGTATTSISALEIAGSGFGTTTVRGLNIVGQATTTSNVGISLSGGCFAINGNCITLSSLASFAPNSIITTNGAGNLIATGTQLTVGNLLSTTTAASYFLGSLGVGTSTTNATLDVAGTGAGKVFEASGSSGAPFLSVSNTGFGTTTLSGLNVAGSATSTANVGFNLTNGCFAVNGACIVSAAGAGSVNGGFTGQFAYYASDGSTVSGTSALTVDGSGNIGVNNASPAGRLHVLGESTDGAVLVVDQGASSNPWAIQFSRSGFSDATVQLVGSFALGWQASLDPYTDDNSNFTLGTASKRWNSLFVGTGSSQFDGALTLNGAVTANSAFSLPNLSQGFAYLGSSGTVNTIASSSVKLSWFNNDAGFLTSLSGAASSTLLADANAFSNTNNFTGKLGLASSSPWGQLSVNPTSANGAAPSFAIGSSTATNFVVTNAGFVGIGTTSPQTILALPASTVATGGISFGDDAHLFRSGSGILATEGTFASNVLYASAFGFIPTLYGSNAAGGDLSLESTADANKGRIFLGANGGYIGVGTSTVSGIAGTTIASSTASQLALSAGAGLAQWAFRNAGGNLYISTTTVAGTATSTQSALSINGTTGALSLGTTTAGVLKTTSAGLVYADNSLQSAASSTLLSDTNTFTGRQIFTNSSTTLGSFAYASATAANIGTLTLGSLTSGFAGIGANGQTYSFATSTIKTSQLTNDANFTQFPFTVNTGYNSTSTAIGFGGGLFSTASSTFSSALRLPSLTQGVAYVGSTGLVNTTSTSTLAVGSSLSSSGTLGFQLGGSNTTLSLNLANANIWTALQTFNYSSSTVYSSFVSASTTNLNIGLSQGFAYLGTGGRVNSIASSSINLSWFNNDAGFLTSLAGAASSTLLSDTNFFSGVNRFALSSTTYGSFATASTTNLILNGQSFNSLLGTGLSNVSGALTIDTTAQNNAINSYIAASTTIPKTYTSNTFTALQTFGNSSTTLASFGYASSTVANIGTLNLGLSTGGLAVNGAGQVYSFSTSTWTFASSTLLSDANTFSGADRFTGSFSLPSLSQGFAYLGTGGLVNTIASSSVNLSWFNNDAGFLTSLSGAASSTLLSDTNTFTGRQTFTNSSTTLASFAYASATTANIGTLNLGSLASGFAGIGANGQTYSFATSTIKTSQLTNDAGFVTAAGAFPFTSVAGYNSTSTAIGFTGGLFSTASSTFSSALRLSSLSQGFAYTGSTGLVSTISTSTLASQIFAANTFAANSIITTNASGNLIATGTQLTVGNLLSTTTANSYFLGTVGIGTTTPVGAGSLDITSNLSPQLFLGSGVAGQAMTAFRNDGTVFSIGTTTIAGTATSSINALEIALGGFGTTTVRGLNIVGQATTTSNVGLNITNGCYAIGGNCLNLSGTFPFTSQTYGNSTSSVIGFTGGLFSTASSTFSSSLRLSSLSQGFTYLGSGGTVNSIASSSVNLSWFNNDAGFLTSLSGAASSTLLADTNTFTGRQIFTNSSTTLGSFQYASATTANVGTLTLGSLTGGFAGIGANGQVYSFATSTIKTSQLTNDAGFLTSLSGAASSTLLADANTFSGVNRFSNSVLLTSLSQGFAYLGTGGLIQTLSTSTLASQIFNAQTFAANSIITTNASGNLIATGTQLTVGNLLATSTTATSTFRGGLQVGTSNFIVDRSTGFVGIGTSTPNDALNVYTTNPWGGVTVQGGTSADGGGLGIANDIGYGWGIDVYGSANSNFPPLSNNFAIYDNEAGVDRLTIDTLGRVGISTDTPQYLLTLATSTKPQLALSAGAGFAQWAFRNANGNFYLSTTTVAGTSTSTQAALSINGTTGALSLGTTTAGLLRTTSAGLVYADTANYATFGFPFTSVAGYNATGTTIGFTNGIFATASSTFSSALRLSSLSQGFAYLGTSGTVNSIASSSVNLSWFNNDAGFLTSLSGAASSTLLSDMNFFSGVNRFALSSTTYGSFTTASSTNFRTGFLTLSTTTAGILKTTSAGAVYVDTSSGTAASSTLLADFNTFSNTNNFTGKLGLASSTPWGQLSINPNALGSGVPEFVIGSSSATHLVVTGNGTLALGTSTPSFSSFSIPPKILAAGSDPTAIGNAIVNSDTTGVSALTFGNDIALTGAYFTFNGFSGSGTSGLYGGAASFNMINAFAAPITFGTNNLVRATISAGGNFGIGTSSPYAKLSVAGEIVGANLTATSTTATSTIAGGLTVGNGAINYDYSSGVTSIANLQIGGTSFDSDAGIVSWMDMPVTSASPAGTEESYTANINGNPVLSIFGRADGSGGLSQYGLGVGTSTTSWLATFASATQPQLALSAGSGIAQFTFRNAGGNLYISTTTAAGSATTSTAALTINGSTGAISISTTTAGILKVNAAGLIYSDTSSGTAASSTLLSDVNFFSGVNRFALSSTTYGSFTTASTTNFRTGFFTLSTSTAGTLKTTSTGAVYVDTSSGTAASSTLLADFNTFSNTNNFTGKLGLASSTPWGQLSINPTSANGSAPSFVIGSSTGTNFVVGSDGGVAIGTSTTYGAGSLSLYAKNGQSGIDLLGDGDGNNYASLAFASSQNNYWYLTHSQGTNHAFKIGYTSDNVSFYDPFIIEPLAPDYSFYINSAGHIGIGTSTPNAFLTVSGASAVPSDPTVFNLDAAASEPAIMTFTSGSASGATVGLSAGANNFFTGTQAGDFALLSASGHNVFLGVNNNAGNNVPTVMVGNGFAAIGTTSAYYGYGLTIASSTKPQLSLSAGAGLAQWTFRNAGGNFYLSTTTVAGTATTSTAALTILNGGNVGIGTTNPGYSLQVAGSADILQTEAELVVSHAAGASLAYGTNNKLFFGNASYMTMSGTANYIENTNDDGVFSIRATGLRGQLALKATGSTNPSITFTTGSFERARFDLNGNFGIGTTSPGSILSIGDTSGINFTTATSTFNSTGGINLSGGCFAIAGSCIGSGSFSNTIANGGTGSTSFAPNSIIVSNAAGTALIATGSQLTVGSLVSTTTNPSYFLGRLGIGTYDPDTDFLLDLYGSEATPYASTGGTSVPAGGISASITNDSDTDNAGAYLLLASSNGGTTYSRAYIGGISTPSSESAQIVFGQRTAGGYAERMRIDSTGNIGIGTSTPWGLLSVNPNNLGSNVPEFIIGSSSMSHFVVNGAGQVGIGQFDGTVDVSLQIAGSDATTYAPTGAGKVAGGPFSIEMTNTSQTNTAGSYISLGSFNAAGTKVRSYIGSISVANSGTPSLVFGQSTSADASTHNEVMRIDSTGNVAVGTTTPGYLLTIASSTAPQLALSAGSGIAQWAFRNAGGNFYLATTTVAGTATSTLAALTINGTTGALSLGTTTAGCLQTTSAGLVFAATCASGASDAFTHSTIFSPTSATTSKIGIGTTTPYYSLTVASSTGAQLALSSGTAGLAQWVFRNAGGNFYLATTTVAGTSTSTLAALTVQTSTGNVGIASTTPWAQLSISPTGTSNSFAIGSSSQTQFLVTGSGLVGIGTSNPGYNLDVNSSSNSVLSVYDASSDNRIRLISNQSTVAALVASNGATSLDKTLMINANPLLLNPLSGNRVGIGTSSPVDALSVQTTSAGGGITLRGGTTSDGTGLTLINSDATANFLVGVSGSANAIGSKNFFITDGNTGANANFAILGGTNTVTIGTTTASSYGFVISTSTRPQLVLSTGAGLAQWAFRNAGGNFYLATTTVAGTATSTLAALTINGTTGALSLGTTTAGTLKITSTGLVYADPSGGGGGYATVQDEGSNLTTRTTLNFTGTGVSCIDNSGSSRTDCTINTSAASLSIGSAITGATPGSVLFADASSNLAQDNSNFFWDASGKRLGLGTTTPFAKLSVNSTAGQAALVVGSSTATSLIVDAYGNVGIGTSTVPTGGLGTSKLTISDSDASAITANLVNTSSTGISAYGLGNDATPSLAAIFTSGSSGAGISGLFGGANSLNVMNFANAPLAFGTNGTVQATLTGAGNLGIGTTNPGDSRLFVYNNIAAPSAVTPNIYSLVEGKGDNATLKGVMGGYFQAKDRTDVDGTNKGILYGVTIDIAPSVARNNVPYDDATGLLVSNAGTAKATDAIYVGNNPSIVGSQWVSGVLVETNADYAYRAVGTFSTALMNLDDQFFVAPDGSTGIGTTSPVRKFSLVGDMFLNTSNIWLGTTTSATGSTSTIFALATTSILINPDAAMAFSIGTSSNAYGNGTGPILNIATSKSGANSTTTLGIFVATTTGLYAGKGTPMTKGNHIFIGDGISTTTINIARGNLCIDSDGYCNVATGTANTQGGQIYARKYVTSAADLAEMYTSTDNLVAGELVSASANSVSRATRATESTLIGVVSTDPGFVLGDQGSGYPIALAGRVPVKVNDENGPISAGDAITISSTPGVGMKAGNRSRVVAIALEDLVGSSGTISAFITKYTYTDETLFNINENGNIGIGTSSPVFGLTAYSATAPQFALSAGAGLAQWTFRNAGGNFYLGTSTINGLSTTSTSALTVAGSGFGTTTVTGLNINAQATTTSNVGMNITGGCYAVNGTCVGGGSGDTGTSKFIVKSSDETVNSGTTLQTDDELSFPIASGETWVFDFTLIVDNYNSATPDWKSAILGASGWSCKVVLSGAEGAGTAFPQATTTDCDNSPTTTVNNAVSAAPGGMNVHMQGWITATSDGTVQLEWAPNTSGKLTVLAGSYVLAQKVGGADLAEVYYTKDASIEAGDVVSLDKDVVAGVKKANKAFGRDTLGIVSTKPGLLLGDGETNTDDLPVRVALAGRVPVKVSDEGGNIAVGDSIAASSEDGYGMKAHPGDTVIATALASVDFASSTHGIVLAFVNKSNDVPALSGLDMMVVGTSTPGLEAVKGMAPVTYSFGNSSSTRFGFVPEDLETLDPHFVSVDESGKITGINYDQLTPVLVSSIQELDVKVDSLDARLANLEALVGTSTSSGGGGASLDGILAAFEDLGAKFMQGIAYIRNLVVDSLTVGSHDKPSGITLFDDVTGDPYCLKMHDGAMVSAAGACENMATSTPEGDGGSGDGSGEEAPAGDTTSPVITVNGENPATIFYGATYSDMGASVRDIDENGQVNDNLGLHFTVDGVDMPQVSIDASISTSSPQTATTTHVIVYSAVDGAGNWGYATRTVDVIPQQ